MVIEGGRRVEERRQGFHVEPREVRVAAERVLVEAPLPHSESEPGSRGR